MEEILLKDKMEMLLDFIMKKCLWQFHSRAWDRMRQNENVIAKTAQILCGEPVKLDTPEERCYWIDAVYLADNYRKRFSWVCEIEKNDLKKILQLLKERLDFLLVTGSLNAELKDPHY